MQIYRYWQVVDLINSMKTVSSIDFFQKPLFKNSLISINFTFCSHNNPVYSLRQETYSISLFGQLHLLSTQVAWLLLFIKSIVCDQKALNVQTL